MGDAHAVSSLRTGAEGGRQTHTPARSKR
jgi:hypothetical protein